MYAHGLGYRYVPLNGKKVSLGRDLEAALEKYYLLTMKSFPRMMNVEQMADAMWRRHKKGAKQRGIEFTISAHDVSDVLYEQEIRCAVTRLEFNGGKPDGSRIRPWMPSIDRISSARGYHKDNIRVVCAFVNVAMNGFGDQFFAQILAPLIDAKVEAKLAALRIRIPDGNFSRT